MALSGGADSAACAWLAAYLGPTRALHIHHGLPTSDLMERAARAVSGELDIRVEVVEIEVDPWSEGKARQLRYEALLGALEPGEWLLTGHTADDQAETVFANLLRGAGIEGLAGIPARRAPVARPLLGVDRSGTRELATLAGLAWNDDPANFDLGPLRNRLRLRLLPQIEAEYNPSFRQHLVDVARTASALDQGPVVSPVGTGNEFRLPVPMLNAVGPEVAIRSIRDAVRRFRDGYSLSRPETERVWKVLQRSLTATELAGGIKVRVVDLWLVFTIASNRPAPIDWRVPGSISWGRFHLEASVAHGRPSAMPLSPWQVVLDFDRVGDILSIRSGPGGAPELLAGDRVIWEVGRRSHASGWIDDTTRRYLCAQCVEEATLL